VVGGTRKKERRNIPGNSVSEIGDRMNGGAVKDDKSPENDAILYQIIQVTSDWI
jgi:hypothetical protein